jgi:hypothetical protein
MKNILLLLFVEPVLKHVLVQIFCSLDYLKLRRKYVNQPRRRARQAKEKARKLTRRQLVALESTSASSD